MNNIQNFSPEYENTYQASAQQLTFSQVHRDIHLGNVWNRSKSEATGLESPRSYEVHYCGQLGQNGLQWLPSQAAVSVPLGLL